MGSSIIFTRFAQSNSNLTERTFCSHRHDINQNTSFSSAWWVDNFLHPFSLYILRPSSTSISQCLFLYIYSASRDDNCSVSNAYFNIPLKTLSFFLSKCTIGSISMDNCFVVAPGSPIFGSSKIRNSYFDIEMYLGRNLEGTKCPKELKLVGTQTWDDQWFPPAHHILDNSYQY